MKKHVLYARYLLLHKWYVLRAGLRTGAPLWRLLVHDWSKFRPSEWFTYAEAFYGKKDIQNFKVAWLRHQNRNPHHWNYWVIRNNDGTVEPLEVPEVFVREMVADWMGAGRAKGGTSWSPSELATWYGTNSAGMSMHPRTRVRVESLISEMTE